MILNAHRNLEAELTLGNLFRSRERKLIERYAFTKQLIAVRIIVLNKIISETTASKRFYGCRLYDRAEALYIVLIDEPNLLKMPYNNLPSFIKKQKEWKKKAINVAEKLAKIAPDTDPCPLAHYYCEYALTLPPQQENKSIRLLTIALDLF